MVLVALVAVALTILLTSALPPLPRLSSSPGSSRKETWSVVSDASFWSFALPVAQSYTFSTRGGSQQAVAGMWLVLSVIICTVYRSNLKAMLIKPRLVLPFGNLKELAESGIPCFTFRGTLLHRNIEAAEEGTTVWHLKRKLIAHNDVEGAVGDMSTGQHAMFTTYVGLLSVIHSSFVKTKTCSLYMTDDSYFGPRCLTIAFPKGSPLRQGVNPIITKLRESGILQSLFMKYAIHASTCLRSDPIKVDNILRPLQMGDVYGVCLLYVGGMMIATLTLLAEIMVT
ncbi:uncharacterized protein LOC135104903 [Scylla paramamosain]|uniref:uncharacterized protein LOC135104903 n=1 Tax=Scylla paramamosain TaxID=85552 RepID=UPI003082A93C